MTLNLLSKKTEETQTDHYTLDSFLNYFNVPRLNALYEMVLPGLIIGEDRLPEELEPGAAILNVIYRETERTEHLASFIDLVRSEPAYMAGNFVTADGVAAAERITVTMQVKKPLPRGGYELIDEPRSLYDAAMLQNGKRIALVLDRGAIYVNPNVFILPTKELEERLGAKDISGSTFFVPAPVAEGLLLSPTEDPSKQSTCVRCVFPQGAMFLDSWFWADRRKERLQRDKWSEFDISK